MALENVNVGDPHASAHNAERQAINQLELDLGNTIRFDTTQSLTAAQKDIVAGNLMGSLSMARGTTADLSELRGRAAAGSWQMNSGTLDKPDNESGNVVVISDSSYTSHIVTTYPSGRTWSRQWSGFASAWTEWKRLDLHETTANELRGTGSPQGVVSAPPGTYYTDTSGTLGAWRWLKTSGTGTSGWVVVIGDTGPRDVTNLLLAGTADSVEYRRTHDKASYLFRNLQGIPAGPIVQVLSAADLGNGSMNWQRMHSGTTRFGVTGSEGVGNYYMQLSYIGSAYVTSAVTSAVPSGTLTFTVDLAPGGWYSTLPGTPA